jgi:YidC/Oxa1 family membrane protein insertase
MSFRPMPFALLEPVEEPLLGALEWIHETAGVSWAWAIILLTVAVRVLLVPLTVKQQQSMRKLQALQPEIKKLQAKHGKDRQTLNQEMMALYKENKANPMGSCLPLLVQIPIFLAMFFVLRDLDEEMDPTDDRTFLGGFLPDITQFLHEIPTSSLVVLMVVYIGSQVGATLLMPTSLDKMQRYLFLGLPIVFAFVLIAQDFPAGLMLYWITTNLWTVGQAAVIRWVFPNPHLVTASGAAAAVPSAKGGGGGSRASRPATKPKAAKSETKPETKGVHPAARKARSARRPGNAAQSAPGSANGGAPAGRARRRRGGDVPPVPAPDTPPGPGTQPRGAGRRRGRRGGAGESPAPEGGD